MKLRGKQIGSLALSLILAGQSLGTAPAFAADLLEKAVSQPKVVADWKFDQDHTTGKIADGSLIVEDQSGNDNDLKMETYGQGSWEDYLSFSDDSMTGQGGSMVFDGDNSTKTGADFITVDGAAINSDEFRGGYTMEFLYYLPEDWTAADQWMSLIGRQGSGGGNPEGEQGTMYASISNCKEIQYITGNADGDHAMSSAAWSVSMDEGGVWYHIAIVSDGHEISTYVNGCEAFRDYVSDEMVGMYADPNDGRFRVGSSWWNGLDKFLQGSLQEVRISGEPLDKDQWLVPNPEDYVENFGSNQPYTLRDEDDYNIVLIPDTQNTVEYCPDVMDTAIDELIDSADDLNVAGVIHMGDVVDDNNVDAQYVNARDAFYRLPDAGIKFLMQMGNHDGWSSGINNYYNSFSGKSTAWTRRTGWYLTQSPNGDGNSSYMFLRAGSYNYLVISLSCTGSGSGSNNNTSWDSADEAWLRSVLEEYPNCPTIVTTHDLQNCSDTQPSSIKLSAQGSKLWDIVKDYDQVFMLVGGHSHGSGVEELTNTNGKQVISILTDLQFAYNGGNGWFRFLEFNENADKIYYSIYSPYAASLNESEKNFFDVNFLTGPGNEGEIDIDFDQRFAGMEAPQPQQSTEGQWMTGEYHTHTGQSKDATSSFMSLNNVLAAAFHNQEVLQDSANSAAKFDNIQNGDAFDFLSLADHLRQAYNGVDGQGNGKYNTAFYVALETQIREIEKLQVKGEYTDKLINTGFEWDMPGLDHASVGILDKDGNASVAGTHAFEWMYASQGSGDDPTSLFTLDEKADDMDEQAVYGDRQNNGQPQTAYDAVKWLEENYPGSYALPNHPSRHNGSSGEVTIENLRLLNDAAPSVVFGFEGMPGNQMSGSGRCELPDGTIRNGADEMIAVTGGVWDAMLSEGRKFYNFANSDFHFKVSADEQYSSGYWASEYSANQVWVEPGDDQQFSFSDVVEGMRSGNAYAVYGNLISDLSFTVSGADGSTATMGGELNVNEGDQLTVTARFKASNTNNYESLYNTDTGISVDNTPELDHVDLIMGHVTGKVDQSQYSSTDNTDAKIVKTFSKEELASALGEDGYYTLTFPMQADGDLYFRLRGTTVSQVDENGDPLPDTNYSGISDNHTRFDTINDSNYASLCFYANPVWVNVEKAPEAQTQGVENGSAQLDLTKIAGYSAGQVDVDGGVMEIVAYNSVNGYAYAVNGKSGQLAIIPMSELKNTGVVTDLAGTSFDVKAAVKAADDAFSYGDMTSVAVSPDGATLAVALQADGYADAGRVALFTCNKDGSLTLLKVVAVGVQPDMVTFAGNNTVLTADEGEPREGYGDGAADPKGSVSVVDVENGTAAVVDFTSFDAQRDQLVSNGIVLKKDTAPSVDLEPEYIAVSGGKAYVTLQENNAIAVLDLASKTFTGIYSAGFEDYSTTPVDIDKKDEKYAPKTYESLMGIRMPDGIAAFEKDGKTYLLTANEGDSREWGDYLNEDEVNFGKGKTSPTGAITAENSGLTGKVVFFKTADYDGLNAGKDYLFGGRSFTLYEVTGTGIQEVYTSGDDFESLTAKYLPDYFNCSNDNATLDDRSGKKGPEAENVTVGTVDGKTYAFIALERTGGVMVYDVTDPANVSYVNYINSRNFASVIPGSQDDDKWVTGGDVAPEGFAFISAGDSPTGKALLLTACEVSGTVAVYEMTPGKTPEPVDDGLKIAVISDDHLYSTQLGTTGSAFEAYLASDRKMLKESEAILDSALDEIAASGAKYLLIPGDLTKDGELVNHQLMAKKLAAFEQETGIQVFVINGNHDISNANAVSFDGDTTQRVDTVNTDEFRSIYAQFGYDKAIAKDPNSLSYAVDLGDDYRLIVMDSGIYNNDTTNPSQETSGQLTDSRMAWILDQIEDAVRDGRRPIGMMHHGLVPHTAIQPTMFPEYLVKDYETVADTLADAGMNLVFTGHFHSQDVSMTTTDSGSVLYDVETGSLVTSPCPIRYVTLGDGEFSYTTDHVTQVEGIEDFPAYAGQFLTSGMEGLVESMLPAVLMQMDPQLTYEQAAAQAKVLANTELVPNSGITVKSLLAGAFAAHYAGDESMDPVTAQIVAGLEAQSADNPVYQLLVSVVKGLYTDSQPADCAASGLALTQLPDYPEQGGGSSSSGSGSTGSKTETTTNPDGSTTTTVTKPDGSKTETTKAPNGSSSVVTTDKNGNVKAEVQLPADVVNEAAQSGKAVALPMPAVTAATGSKSAATVTVDLPANTSAKVEIPVSAVTAGTVAVLVKADGTEKVIKTTLMTQNGVAITLSDGDTVKIVDNAKTFTDVPATHWGADAVAFATSRELFNGTGAATFDPTGEMTRAMIVTVLARYDGVDTTAGDTWYEAGAQWAVENGVSDGTNLNSSVSREQLVTMLWRLMGSPVVEGDLSAYPDGASVSSWAAQAMAWAVDAGIITGTGTGALNPQGTATRVEVAAMLTRFVEAANR